MPNHRAAPDDLAAGIVLACQVLERQGLTEAFGHLSARLDDEHVLVTKRVAPAQVTSSGDLVRLALDGGTGELPPDVPPEIWLHLAIYRRRPEVEAVCRFHAPYALAVSTAVEALRPSIGYGAYLGVVPVHDDARLARSVDAAERVADSLGDGPAVLLRGNGAVTVGGSIQEAGVRAIFLERAAAALCRGAALGAVTPLADHELAAFARLPDARTVQIERAWTYYIRQLPEEGK
jgi:HCOMODA/2-hydroxy-3-carboxy-muconic semialdehyde decarboxylase